jgi:membrane associated rhomboid family serine protease
VSCLTPNDPAAHFCTKCAAPLSSFASTGPFEHLFAEGSVYRAAAERPRKLVVVLGIWMIFGLMMLVGLFVIGMSLSSQDAAFALKIFGALVGLAVAAVSGTMIWRTTWNYLTRKQTDGHDA